MVFYGALKGTRIRLFRVQGGVVGEGVVFASGVGLTEHFEGGI